MVDLDHFIKSSKIFQVKKMAQPKHNEAEDEDVQFLAELERENQALEMELKEL